MNLSPSKNWDRNSAVIGVFIWVVVAGLAGSGKAPFGTIELLLMFAPLVVVPLGSALGCILLPLKSPDLEDLSQLLQPFAAVLVVVSFWIPPGKLAAALTGPWLLVCLLCALSGVISLLRHSARTLSAIAVDIGRMDLAVAGGWLLLSRLGVHVLGFQEPIVLLTAVHFHYAGFAMAHLAGAAARHAEKYNVPLTKWIAVLVLVSPILLAIGFVSRPIVKLITAMLLSAAVVSLSGLHFWVARSLHSGTPRAFLRVSAVAVLFGIILAIAYSVGDMLHRDWLPIPQMARTHGLLNSLGFVLPGLLGWLTELEQD